MVLAQHCEDPVLAAGGHMHEGEWSSRLGIPGQPAEAEELMVMRDIALARLTGTRVHFQHLSTAGSIAMVRGGQGGGPARSPARPRPHHFTLTHAECASYDPVFKVNPPLRTDADVAAVRAGLADGTIDCIATDHAPHTQEAKEPPFDQAPPGMLGLETALGLALTELDLAARRRARAAVVAAGGDRSGSRPSTAARSRPVARRTSCVIDPDGHVGGRPAPRWPAAAATRPTPGASSRGRVRHTILRGEPVVLDGEAQR